MSAATPLMDEALLLKGRRFRVVKPGARIVGMRSIGTHAWRSDHHDLRVGGIITCLGPVRRLGSDPGPDTIGWSAPGMGTGWSTPEFSPGGTARFWGPILPEQGYLEPSRVQAAEDDLQHLLGQALKGGAGPLVEDPAINEASRALIRAMQDEHGEAWLGQFRDPAGSPEGPVLVKWTGNPGEEPPWSFVLPHQDAFIERMVRAYRQTLSADSWVDGVRRNFLRNAIQQAGGALLAWTSTPTRASGDEVQEGR